MTTVKHTDRETRSLGKRGAFEGVARRHGRRRNPARMTPRSSLRTPTNTPRHSPQDWCEEIGRCIANSETVQPVRPGTQLRGELIEELIHPGTQDLVDRDPIDA